MPTWLKFLVYPFVILFFTILGGAVGVWIPAHGTESDTGAVGAADGMAMILFGIIGLAVGLTLGIIGLVILRFWLHRSRPKQLDPVAPQEEEVWPPPPNVAV